MNQKLKSMLEALVAEDEAAALTLFREYAEQKVHDIIQENLGNVITRPVDSVVVGLPKISNVYTTKKIPKKKKVLPKLNKGKYGTGYAPGSWHGDHASDNGGTGGDGGGDGGGGGGE